MSKTALYWIDGRWQSLEVDNADNLDGKDSLDFSTVGHKHFKSDITDIPGNATTAQDGFMSAADKTKLDGIAINANNYTHPNDVNTRHVTDTEKNTWNSKANSVHNHGISQVDGLQTQLDNLQSQISTSGATSCKHIKAIEYKVYRPDAQSDTTTFYNVINGTGKFLIKRFNPNYTSREYYEFILVVDGVESGITDQLHNYFCEQTLDIPVESNFTLKVRQKRGWATDTSRGPVGTLIVLADRNATYSSILE